MVKGGSGGTTDFEMPETLVVQGFQDVPPTVPPTVPPAVPLPPTQLNLDELELVEMIRAVVAEPDLEVASQTAADILPTLKKVCDGFAADRAKVWAVLTKHEADTFKALTELVAKIVPIQMAPDDAQKLREIATLWWDKYYPEQMQSLVAQMYGWQAPGNKYNVAIITEWLEGEDSFIRDRITELIRLRKG
jgi:hypothetical protein